MPGARGVVGFISPVSEPYCGTCNRMRLTADGKFHLCLLNDDELDVRKAIRSGGGMEAVARILVRAVDLKPTGHHLLEGRSTHDRSMYQIGGCFWPGRPGLVFFCAKTQALPYLFRRFPEDYVDKALGV